MTSKAIAEPTLAPVSEPVAPVLEICDLTVKLNNAPPGKTLVSNVNFEVRPGETVCIVGESGSGKSLTSLSVMGLLPEGILSASGNVQLAGESILKASPARLRALRATQMALVFQEPMTALNPVETVGRQIEEVLIIHKAFSAAERRGMVLKMMRSVHLPSPEVIYNSYPHQLSGGQRQRIVICMALILKPKLLIADEPTTALDVTTQKQILTLIKELQQTLNTAVVFITHDFGVVAEIADRILVMKDGEIIETGTRQEVLGNPKQDYSRMLVSSVPNLVPKPSTRKLGNAILKVKDLNKTYTEFKLFSAGRSIHAVKNAAFELRKGEILGVVGESGSGKSTLARCISRLIMPSSGQVNLNGSEIATLSGRGLREYRKMMQIVFQDPYRSLNARLKVGDSIIEGLVNFGTSRKVALHKAAEVMHQVGMESDVLTRYPHQFSGGQRQRICIARALMLEPDLLIADEAVSALDVTVQAQVLELLKTIRDEWDTGILFITHDLRVAAQLCDTIIVMRNGEIVETDTAHQVLSAPKHHYTRELLDAAPGRDWDFRNFQPISSKSALALSVTEKT